MPDEPEYPLPVHCEDCGAPLKEGFYDFVNADVWELVEEQSGQNVYECVKCGHTIEVAPEEQTSIS